MPISATTNGALVGAPFHFLPLGQGFPISRL